MRISDWSSDVCSSDLLIDALAAGPLPLAPEEIEAVRTELDAKDAGALAAISPAAAAYLPLIEGTGPFQAAMDRLEALNADLGGASDSRIDRKSTRLNSSHI